MTAGEVIESARDRHPAFARNRNPDAVVLRYVSDYARALHGKVAAIDEAALVTDGVTTPLPLDDHDAGIPLLPNRYVAGVAARLRSTPDHACTLPVTLVPWANRLDHTNPSASAWVHGSVLSLRPPATRWRLVAEVIVSLVPVPVTLTSLADPLPLPDTASLALVEQTAFFMARRGHTNPALPGIDIAVFAAAASSAEAAYLADVANRLTVEPIQTRDVRH